MSLAYAAMIRFGQYVRNFIRPKRQKHCDCARWSVVTIPQEGSAKVLTQQKPFVTDTGDIACLATLRNACGSQVVKYIATDDRRRHPRGGLVRSDLSDGVMSTDWIDVPTQPHNRGNTVRTRGGKIGILVGVDVNGKEIVCNDPARFYSACIEFDRCAA